MNLFQRDGMTHEELVWGGILTVLLRYSQPELTKRSDAFAPFLIGMFATEQLILQRH